MSEVEVPPTRGTIWRLKYEIRRWEKELKRAKREGDRYVAPDDRPKPSKKAVQSGG